LAEAQHQARIAEERTVAAVQALEALQRELGRLSASEQAGNRVVDELERALQKVTAELDVAQSAVKSAADTEAEARQRLSTGEGRQAQLLEQRQELQRERLALDAELRQLEGRLLFLKDQQQQLHHQLDAWSSRQGSLTDELAGRRTHAENAERELQEILSRSTAVESELAEVDSSLETARQGMVEREAQLRSLEAELRALRTLLDGAQGRSAQPLTANWERLFELIDVDPRHRAAVEAALEGALYGRVAPDGAAFDEVAATLQGAETARETLLFARESSSSEPLGDRLQPIVNLVSAAAPVLRILDQLLRGAVLAADRAEANDIVAAHPDVRAITAGGEVVTTVSYRGGKSADPVLTLQARIRDAERALEDERAASLAAAQQVEHLATERARLLHDRQLVGDQVNSARTRAAQAAGGLAASTEAMQREALQESQLRQQLSRLSLLIEQAEQAQVDALDRQATIGEREAAVGRELSELSSEIEGAGGVLRVLTEKRQQRELETALVRQRLADLQRQLERAQEVRKGHGNDLSMRRAAEEELAVQPALINEERRQWLERAQALTDEIAAVESLPLPDSAALAGLEAEVRDDEQRNVEFRVELAHADDALAAAAADRDAAQAEVDRCAGALREDGQQVSEADEPIAEVDWQKTEREVSRLQRRLEAMGAVNLLAPQEYAQVRERCDTLADQLADLEQASAQLTELRQRLEAEIDSRFRTVFQAVAVNFQEFFGELFEGGRATLRLESQADGNPLDDGVEILAQTPGKRLQPLTLLSGGERALTALAFLFALQAVNPSPFYVLDEVDAALDDANVVRFNRVLRRLAAAQQFLLVTHNHSTMAQAEALYGVTLGEHGISRIVSVRLQQDNLVPVGERTA
jgi:chromosome segregation protein